MVDCLTGYIPVELDYEEDTFCALLTLFGQCLIDNSKNVGIVQQRKFETICNDFRVRETQKVFILNSYHRRKQNNCFLRMVTQVLIPS